MENPCRILLFGDSIIKGAASKLEHRVQEHAPEVGVELINAGISGETSRDGMARLDSVVGTAPDVAVICFGMNDWRKGVSRSEYKRNVGGMIDAFVAAGVRVLPMTLNPVTEGHRAASNREVDSYSEAVRELAFEKRVKIADVNAVWRDKIWPARRGLRDAIHPNDSGNELVCETLLHVLPRRHTTVLWQYNGREATCNYACPYCYYVGLWNPSDAFFGTIEQWHASFKNSFGDQALILYLAFGEPSIGGAFFDILDMVASEPAWQLRMTTNIAGPVEEIVRTRLARDGRLHINASFHPLTIDRESFLAKAQLLREHGIEVPIVYVAYPPFLDRLEEDIAFFARHGFPVHLRRFQGRYKGAIYPRAYTDEQRRLVARFMDDGSIAYMLNQQRHTGDLTYSGLHFFVVDNVGNVGYDSNVFPPYSRYRCIFGNLHQGNFRPLLRPGPYPGAGEATVDGVANLVKAGYRELEGNNVLAFAAQGGVRVEAGRVQYKHFDTDFTDPAIRARYNFPPTGVRGRLHVVRNAALGSAKRRAASIANSLPSIRRAANAVLRRTGGR